MGSRELARELLPSGKLAGDQRKRQVERAWARSPGDRRVPERRREADLFELQILLVCSGEKNSDSCTEEASSNTPCSGCASKTHCSLTAGSSTAN